MPKLDATTWVRVGAGAFVALAIVASAVESGRKEERVGTASTVSEASHDPLAPELERCGALPPTATPDAACEHAWAANRARFLGGEGSATGHASVGVAR